MKLLTKKSAIGLAVIAIVLFASGCSSQPSQSAQSPADLAAQEQAAGQAAAARAAQSGAAMKAALQQQSQKPASTGP